MLRQRTRRRWTAARRSLRAIAGLPALLALAVVAGCGRPEATVQLNDSTTVALGRGAAVHDVRIGGAGGAAELRPDTVRAHPGDAVRFVTADGRTHAIAFIADSLAPAVRAYLDRTMQLRGPPLVNEGSAWIVLLRGAPAGRYPFQCIAIGRRGLLVVEPRGRD